jgi:hypothetical protein
MSSTTPSNPILTSIVTPGKSYRDAVKPSRENLKKRHDYKLGFEYYRCQDRDEFHLLSSMKCENLIDYDYEKNYDPQEVYKYCSNIGITHVSRVERDYFCTECAAKRIVEGNSAGNSSCNYYRVYNIATEVCCDMCTDLTQEPVYTAILYWDCSNYEENTIMFCQKCYDHIMTLEFYINQDDCTDEEK